MSKSHRSFILVCIAVGYCSSSPLVLLVTNDTIHLGNGYVHTEFDLIKPRISVLSADFYGAGNYGKNVLTSAGIVLERQDGGVTHKVWCEGYFLSTLYNYYAMS